MEHNIKISYILAYYLDVICEHIIFVENLKIIIMKLLAKKKYYDLTAKIYDQEQELTRKNTYIDALESRCDLVSKLAEQNQQLSAIVSELEPIVEKFNHKKNLEKARKQKYRSKLRLRKKESKKTVMPVINMSEAEKFARENAGKEIRHRTYVGYIVGYNIKEDVENDYVLVGFNDGYGWDKTALTENDVFVVDTPMKEYKTYWYLQVGEIILNK